MNRCLSCHARLDEHARVCPECGDSVSDKTAAAEALADYAMMVERFTADQVMEGWEAEELESYRERHDISELTHQALMHRHKSVSQVPVRVQWLRASATIFSNEAPIARWTLLFVGRDGAVQIVHGGILSPGSEAVVNNPAFARRDPISDCWIRTENLAGYPFIGRVGNDGLTTPATAERFSSWCALHQVPPLRPTLTGELVKARAVRLGLVRADRSHIVWWVCGAQMVLGRDPSLSDVRVQLDPANPSDVQNNLLISGRHLRLAFGRSTATAMDLQSAYGTEQAGTPLVPGVPTDLPATTSLTLAGVLGLRVTATRRRIEAVPQGDGQISFLLGPEANFGPRFRWRDGGLVAVSPQPGCEPTLLVNGHPTATEEVALRQGDQIQLGTDEVTVARVLAPR